jgi:hypothetical protein
MAYSFQVSAKILHWPRACACCFGTADTERRAAASRTTGKRVQRTTTMWWDIPYCSPCIRHAKAFALAPRLLLAGLAAAPVLALLLVAANYVSLAYFVAILSCVLGIWSFFAVRGQARLSQSPTCASKHQAVRYVDWYGTMHTFVFANQHFLRAFMELNERKTMSDVRQV